MQDHHIQGSYLRDSGCLDKNQHAITVKLPRTCSRTEGDCAIITDNARYYSVTTNKTLNTSSRKQKIKNWL